jgi:rhodanese-related sulfurtransferase
MPERRSKETSQAAEERAAAGDSNIGRLRGADCAIHGGARGTQRCNQPGAPWISKAAGHCAETGSMGRTIISMNPLPLEITPLELQRRIAAGEKLALIDVREPQEFQLARIEGAELIPMRTVPAELSRLDARADDAPLIVFCHHGVRSLNVVHWLREQGVDACQSLAGGIDRWSLEIDPAVPRYS